MTAAHKNKIRESFRLDRGGRKEIERKRKKETDDAR